MSSSDSEDDLLAAYQKDSRIPCQYGIKCYQKNPHHRDKYKHPPNNRKNDCNDGEGTDTRKKRKRERKDKDKDNIKIMCRSPKATSEITCQPSTGRNLHNISPNSGSSDTKESDSECAKDEIQKKQDHPIAINPANSTESSVQTHDERPNSTRETIPHSMNGNDSKLSQQNAHAIISDLFLVEMPGDFYKFYDFCTTISKNDPLNAFKSIQLKLVGPYDVLADNLGDVKNNKEKYLRHWRYYYDPPEFQTIIKGNDKEGFHFGYWRDDLTEAPVFVAKNKANVNCIIEPVAENVFGAIDSYIDDKIKTANPFEKMSVIRLHRLLKQFAKENNIILEKNTPNMRNREKKVVARTFHKAGIVVPYDKKTQLGYRDLSVTDSELTKMLKEIEGADSSEKRVAPLAKLEDVVRLATIAADECDFGTCLELGHDLFSSGVVHVQNMAEQMLTTAYNLLQRPQLLKIVKSHLMDRRKGCNLSVI